MFNFFTKLGLFICAFLFIILSNANTQTGNWVPQEIDQSMDGSWFYDAGETIVMVTSQYSRYVYFFDINSSTWSIVDCKSTQNFKKYAVKGHTAMIFSDTILIGYSGLSSQWDTVYYSGKVLDINPWSGDPSYGCGEYLAYFVTDKCVYIFDSELGEWKSHEYSLPFTYASNNGRFWARGDYVGIIMYNQSNNIYYNLAYSLHKHEFAELTNGGFYSNKDYGVSHGFIAYWTDFNVKKLIAYSAFTNNFSILTLPYSALGGDWTGLQTSINLITTNAFYRKEILGIDRWCRLHMYGYDTRHGIWVYHSWDYNDSIWGIGIVELGGQFATINLYNFEDGFIYYWLFSGIDNSFRWVQTGLKSFGGKVPPYGGKIISNRDDYNVWVYSITSSSWYMISLKDKDFYTAPMTDDFGVIALSDNANPEILHLSIYNEPYDKLTQLVIPKFSVSTLTTQYILSVPILDPNKAVFCYSGIKNGYKIIEFSPSATLSNFSVKKIFAYMAAGSTFIFYDGSINEYFTIPNFMYYQAYSVGENIILVKSATNKFYTYSTLFNTLEEKSITENVKYISAGNFVGLITTPIAANKFYAYNGFYGNIVQLAPSSTAVDWDVGGLTAVVISSDTIYAFNPQLPTSIKDQDLVNIPKQVKLYQNYPNPFNPTTKIKFELSGEKLSNNNFVSLKIYDLLGREVRTLVDEVKLSGTYEVEWDGRDDQGKKLASGVYVYRIIVSDERGKVNQPIQSRKMILLQ